MKRSDFEFELPKELIAQEPLPRGASRLLALCGQELLDLKFTDLPALLRPGDLMVFNDTRVIPARLFGRKESGGRVELLLERILKGREALAHLRASKPPRPGQTILLEDGSKALVLGREGGLFRLRFEREPFELLEAIGQLPLPPYLRRPLRREDWERYQTVYARKPGAVAAPTAGLHFSEALLSRLEEQGIKRAFITLHVGAGTFQPVRVEEIAKHRMYPERFELPEETVAAIRETKARGGRVVAVGTTVVRTLETVALSGKLRPMRGETDLFIYPGFQFRVVDLLLTNFHLPGSTLLMLVCAFGGYGRVMGAYRHAVERRYRFFSYGDAMLLDRSE